MLNSERVIREICFAGAATRGISYLGVLKKLRDENLLDNIVHVVGVSIGSLIGLTHIIGYKPEEIMELVISTDLSKFSDININNMLLTGTILEGKIFRKWVWDLLEKKIDPLQTTFLDLWKLNPIKFTVVSTSLQNGMTIFSKDTTPDTIVYEAVIGSMALPFILPSIEINNEEFIDGCVIDNFPIQLLTPDIGSVGITVTESRNGKGKVSSIFDRVSKIIQLVSERIRYLSVAPTISIISINTYDFDTVNFEISLDDKVTLYRRGYESVTKFLA